MLLAGGSGVEDLVANSGAMLEPTAAAASVAFLGSLLNRAEEVRGVVCVLGGGVVGTWMGCSRVVRRPDGLSGLTDWWTD